MAVAIGERLQLGLRTVCVSCGVLFLTVLLHKLLETSKERLDRPMEGLPSLDNVMAECRGELRASPCVVALLAPDRRRQHRGRLEADRRLNISANARVGDGVDECAKLRVAQARHRLVEHAQGLRLRLA